MVHVRGVVFLDGKALTAEVSMKHYLFISFMNKCNSISINIYQYYFYSRINKQYSKHWQKLHKQLGQKYLNQFSPSKAKTITFTQKVFSRYKTALYFDNEELVKVTCHQSGKSPLNIQNVTEKIKSKMINCISSSIYRSSRKLLKTIYRTFILPIYD